MQPDRLIAQFADNARRIGALATNVSPEQARYKPDPASWSILEVVNHLWDEEQEDFRAFLDTVLHHRGQARRPIDPQSWVTERHYNERDLGESLQHLAAAREDSLAWLRGLAAPDWDAAYQATWGTIRAGDILAAWVAHDLLHMRQLVELHWAYTRRQVEPYSTRYAGEW